MVPCPAYHAAFVNGMRIVRASSYCTVPWMKGLFGLFGLFVLFVLFVFGGV